MNKKNYYRLLGEYQKLMTQKGSDESSFDPAQLDRIKTPLIKGLRRCMIDVGVVIVDRQKKNKNDPKLIGLKAHMDKLNLLYEKVTTEQPIQDADYLDSYYQLPLDMRLAGSPLTLVLLLGILAYWIVSNVKKFAWKLGIMDILGLMAFLVCISVADKVDTKITKKIKEKMGDAWRNHRFFFVALHLFFSGIGFFGGFCLFSVIRGDVPQYFAYFTLSLTLTTAIFAAVMLYMSVLCFFKALFGSGKESSEEYHNLMKKAFLTLVYFVVGTVVLFYEYQFFF